MRLKLLTTIAIVTGAALLMCWPYVYRLRPRGAYGFEPSLRIRRDYVLMFGGYVGATLFSFMTAGALSVVAIRQAREDFQKLAMDNMRDLVEGSIEDLRGKGNPGKPT